MIILDEEARQSSITDRYKDDFLKYLKDGIEQMNQDLRS